MIPSKPIRVGIPPLTETTFGMLLGKIVFVVPCLVWLLSPLVVRIVQGFVFRDFDEALDPENKNESILNAFMIKTNGEESQLS